MDKAIEQSRKYLEEGNSEMAIYVLRDLPEIEGTLMEEIAWLMYKEGTSVREVEGFIEDLENKKYEKFRSKE